MSALESALEVLWDLLGLVLMVLVIVAASIALTYLVPVLWERVTPGPPPALGTSIQAEPCVLVDHYDLWRRDPAAFVAAWSPMCRPGSFVMVAR